MQFSLSIPLWYFEKKIKKKKKKKKKEKKKSFSRHSPRCSFLSVSLHGTMRKKEKKKIKKKHRLLGIRQDAVFLQFLFMVLSEKKKKNRLAGIRQGSVF